VAALSLVGGVVLGIVPFADAFAGFSDQIVVTVASALVVSAGLMRSGVVDWAVRPIRPLMRGPVMEVFVLTALVTAASGFVKNIAALAMLMPVALQVARRSGRSPGDLLMPMSFGALLGGLVTLIGTSPNIIVSRVRAEIVGTPFAMFDFAPVGIALAVAGTAFLAVGWRLLPRRRRARSGAGEAFAIDDYTFETKVPAGSPFVNRTVAELEAMAEGEASVVAIVRERYRRYVPAGHWWIFADDVLVIQGDATVLRTMIAEAGLELVGDRRPPGEGVGGREVAVVEAVVTPGSTLVGQSAEQLALRERIGLNLLGMSRRGARIRQRLRRLRFQPGDLLVLQGPADTLSGTLAEIGCLPLAERNLPLGRKRRLFVPLAILAVAVAAVSFQVVPVQVGFFAAAVAMILTGALTPDDAYRAVDWPVLILLACLIPVSESLQRTGVTDLIAEWLAAGTASIPPTAALGLVLVAAMAVTPFLNNAATVLVMAPIGAGLATRLGLSADPFLMAVAVGAACDFLTPIGHQCNTLVMGPGGYRFGDYWRLGLPLSVLVAVLGTVMIAIVWPLAP
jgi:di/tricarboxylate transporter